MKCSCIPKPNTVNFGSTTWCMGSPRPKTPRNGVPRTGLTRHWQPHHLMHPNAWRWNESVVWWDGNIASVLVERSWCMNQWINIHTAHTSKFYLCACLMIGHQKVDEVSQWGIQISWHRAPSELFLLKTGSVTILPFHINFDSWPKATVARRIGSITRSLTTTTYSYTWSFSNDNLKDPQKTFIPHVRHIRSFLLFIVKSQTLNRANHQPGPCYMCKTKNLTQKKVWSPNIFETLKGWCSKTTTLKKKNKYIAETSKRVWNRSACPLEFPNRFMKTWAMVGDGWDKKNQQLPSNIPIYSDLHTFDCFKVEICGWPAGRAREIYIILPMWLVYIRPMVMLYIYIYYK